MQVTLRQFEPAPNVVILHPFGSLEITEKLVPLNLPIQRLGTQRIGDGHTFGVEHVLLGTKPGQIAPLREQFAPAQFIDMNDAQKLSSQSFERYEAGVQVGGGDAVNATYVKHLDLNYEVIYVPEHHDPVFFKLSDDAFSAFAGSGAVSRSTLSKAQTGAVDSRRAEDGSRGGAVCRRLDGRSQPAQRADGLPERGRGTRRHARRDRSRSDA